MRIGTRRRLVIGVKNTQGGIRIGIASVQRIVCVDAEIEIAGEIHRLADVPLEPLDVSSRLESMARFVPGKFLVEIEDIGDPIKREPPVIRQNSGVRHTAKRRGGDEIQRIVAWIELAGLEPGSAALVPG